MSYWNASANEAMFTNILITIIFLIVLVMVLYNTWQINTQYNEQLRAIEGNYYRPLP